MLRRIALSTTAILAAAVAAHAQTASGQIGDVFVIAMENQNSAVSGLNASGLNPIYGNSAATYINSLITPGNPSAQYTSYSSNYTDIVVNSTTDLHPSEPNYVYQISGQIPPLTDNVPSAANGNVYGTNVANLGQSLTSAGLTWKSYQEDAQIPGVNLYTNASGTNGPVNPYNGTTQYNYAAKHDPFVFFQGDSDPSNSAPLTQLSADLANNTVANFNWITPDQYNDMHTALNGSWTDPGTGVTYYNSCSGHAAAVCGNQMNIAQGDYFLSQIIPEIEASRAWQDNGLIVIWTDENEGDTPDTNGQYTNMEILISKDAQGNAYTDFVPMNHNTDLESYLQLWNLNQSGYPTAVTASDTFSSLLKTGALAGAVPEPSEWTMMLIGFGAVGLLARRRTRLAVAA